VRRDDRTRFRRFRHGRPTSFVFKSEIPESRRSKSRPGIGVVKVRTVTLNQKDEPVEILVAKSGCAATAGLTR
jgi:hypothetical protein